MNTLQKWSAIFSEWGFNGYFPHYNEEEVEACILYLKLTDRYNILNVITMLAKLGIYRVIDICDEAVEVFC